MSQNTGLSKSKLLSTSMLNYGTIIVVNNNALKEVLNGNSKHIINFTKFHKFIKQEGEEC